MTITFLLQIIQLIVAIFGCGASAYWFFEEKYRARYEPALFFVWCFMLVLFRGSRFIFFPYILTEKVMIELYNSLANTIFLSGAMIVLFVSIVSIVNLKKKQEANKI
mgnify:CR=1 FL=1